MRNPDKEQIINLVSQLLSRSGFTIDQALARMQTHGCNLSRTMFENRFTTRVDQLPNIPPDWLLALIAAFTERLTDQERCTAAEAIELARLTRLPIDQFSLLKNYFPAEEFDAAYRRYAPSAGAGQQPPPAPSSKTRDVCLTYHPADEPLTVAISSYLQGTGLTLYPLAVESAQSPAGAQGLATCHTWLICLGPETLGRMLAELTSLPEALNGVTPLPLLLPGARLEARSRLPHFLQRAPWLEFSENWLADGSLTRLTATIRAAIPRPNGDQAADLTPTDPRCPYRGLQLFDEAHADFFFGREADTQWLLEALRDSRFLAVIGPSGSGKSSLVRAGLIPALRQGGLRLTRPDDFRRSPQATLTGTNSADWLIQILEPGHRPLEALALALLQCSHAGQATIERAFRSLIEELEADERGLHFLAQELLLRHPGKSYLALVIDQFEELFTLGDDETMRRAFIANLLYASAIPEGRVVVILTMRADFYSEAARYPDLAVYLADRQVLISPLTGTELIQAITRPAHKVGLRFETGLIEQLLRDAAAEPGALPLLQHALLELWERRDGALLTFAAYRASGGVQGALAQRADRLLQALTPAQQEIVRRVMLRLTRLGEGTADTRRRATLAELSRTPEEAGSVRSVVTQLANARLVTTSVKAETGQEIVDVAHEALIRGWPALQGWLTSDREALRLHQQLTTAAQAWADSGREESYLYRGARLAAAAEWAERHAVELNNLEREFLATSLTAKKREATAQEQRRRRTLTGLTIGLIITLILALLALSQWQQVEAERRATLSRQLAAQGREILAEQFEVALLLSAEAYRIVDTFEARDSLLTVLEASPHLITFLRGHTGWVWAVAFSPDGQILASAGNDGTVRLWDTTSHQPLGPLLTGHTDWVRTVAFSPDGQTLVSGSADKTLIFWDVTTGQPLGPPLRGHASFVTDVAFSADGRFLASGSADGVVRLWDALSREPLGPPLSGHTSWVLSLALSPDGQRLASGDERGTIILWDISQRLRPTGLLAQIEQPLAQALTEHQGAISGVAFSPDGQILASGSADGSLMLWDAASGQPRRQPLTGHTAAVTDVAFSPDGQTLISGSEDQTLILWDAQTGQSLDRSFIGHSGAVLGLAFGPNPAGAGKPAAQTAPSRASGLVASGSKDGTIILWDAARQYALGETLTGHTGSVRDLAFSPDGQTLASAGTDLTARLWDVPTRQPLGPPLNGQAGFVNGVTFSLDGQILASAHDDQAVILWDVATGQQIGSPLTVPQGPVSSVAFSPDGQILAAGVEETNPILLWNVTTRQSVDLASSMKGKRPVFSPDGQLLAGWGGEFGKEIMLWDMTGHQLLEPPLFGHTETIANLAFSPDGKQIASSSDKRIILWDVASHQALRQPLTVHTERINDLAFNADGRILASAGEDGQVILWDVASHQPLGPPLDNEDRVRGVAFSPNRNPAEELLAWGGRNDGSIVLWAASPAVWRAQACQRVGRNLTRTEWARYLGNEPYRVTCPEAPLPAEDDESILIAPEPNRTLTVTPALLSDLQSSAVAAIVETFDTDRGFIQTSDNVYIDQGQVKWHIERSGGEQYIYRPIPSFSGNVRLTAQGQIDSWTNNCSVQAGIGAQPGSGAAISFSWAGGGCPTRGTLVEAKGVREMSYAESNCSFSGDWLWIEPSRSYTTELTLVDGAATLAVEGVGQAFGAVDYEGPYTTLWVGNTGRGDWPECAGVVDWVKVEPLE